MPPANCGKAPHGGRLAVGFGAAAAAATVLGLLAWWSGGAAGPGRLAEVGPDPWPVAAVAALTAGLGAIVGGYAARARSAREPDAAPYAVDDEPAAEHREFVWGSSGRRDAE